MKKRRQVAALQNLLLPQIPTRRQQLSIQNRRARRAANRIVTQGHKAIIEHVVRADASDRNAHTVSRVAIQTRETV